MYRGAQYRGPTIATPSPNTTWRLCIDQKDGNGVRDGGEAEAAISRRGRGVSIANGQDADGDAADTTDTGSDTEDAADDPVQWQSEIARHLVNQSRSGIDLEFSDDDRSTYPFDLLPVLKIAEIVSALLHFSSKNPLRELYL